MRRFEIYTNTTKDPDRIFEKEVASFLIQHGAEYVTCGAEGLQGTFESDFDPECCIVLGGDGTVLRAAALTRRSGIPILGINLGTVGYLAETEKARWKEALTQLLQDDYTVEDRMMLEGYRIPNAAEQGSREQKGTDPTCQHALNDIVIGRSGALRIMNYDVYIGGKLLNSYRADGMIVCTPTGSTAYNLSAGGPIVEPGAEMIVLTPICPHQIGIRSIVVAASSMIEIVIGPLRKEENLRDAGQGAEAHFDGNERIELQEGDHFVIRRSKEVTRLVKLENRSFLDTVHRKLG